MTAPYTVPPSGPQGKRNPFDDIPEQASNPFNDLPDLPTGLAALPASEQKRHRDILARNEAGKARDLAASAPIGDQIVAGARGAWEGVKHLPTTVAGMASHAVGDLGVVSNAMNAGMGQPNSLTPEEAKKVPLALLNTAALPAYAMAPELSLPVRSAVNAGLGAINDPEQPFRGATAGLLLGETLHQAPKFLPERVKPPEMRLDQASEPVRQLQFQRRIELTPDAVPGRETIDPLPGFMPNAIPQRRLKLNPRSPEGFEPGSNPFDDLPDVTPKKPTPLPTESAAAPLQDAADFYSATTPDPALVAQIGRDRLAEQAALRERTGVRRRPGGVVPDAVPEAPANPFDGLEEDAMRRNMAESGFATAPSDAGTVTLPMSGAGRGGSTVDAVARAKAMVGPDKLRELADAELARRGDPDVPEARMAAMEQVARHLASQTPPEPIPMRLYHGTRAGPFEQFKVGHAPGWGEGVYFTDNAEQAATEFGDGPGGRLVHADVTLRNPFNGDGPIPKGIEDTKAYADAVQRRYARDTHTPVEDRYLDPVDAWQDDSRFVGDALRELGYDGIVANHSNGIEGKEVVAFHPHQAKIVEPIPSMPDGFTMGGSLADNRLPGAAEVPKVARGSDPTTLPEGVTPETASLAASIKPGKYRAHSTDALAEAALDAQEAIEKAQTAIAASATRDHAAWNDPEATPESMLYEDRGMYAGDTPSATSEKALARAKAAMAGIEREFALRGVRGDDIADLIQGAKEQRAERAGMQSDDALGLHMGLDDPFGEAEPAPVAGSGVPAGADPATQGTPRDLRADEHLVNRDKFAQDADVQRQLDETEQSLLAQGKGKRVVSTTEGLGRAKTFAETVGLDPKQLDLTKVGQLSGEQIVGLQQSAQARMAQITALSKRLADPTLSDAQRAELSDLIDQHKEARETLIDAISKGRSQKGRDLNFLKQMTEHSLDPDVWEMQARKLAGDRALSDDTIADIRRLAREAKEACG